MADLQNAKKHILISKIQIGFYFIIGIITIPILIFLIPYLMICRAIAYKNCLESTENGYLINKHIQQVNLTTFCIRGQCYFDYLSCDNIIPASEQNYICHKNLVRVSSFMDTIDDVCDNIHLYDCNVIAGPTDCGYSKIFDLIFPLCASIVANVVLTIALYTFIKLHIYWIKQNIYLIQSYQNELKNHIV